MTSFAIIRRILPLAMLTISGMLALDLFYAVVPRLPALFAADGIDAVDGQLTIALFIAANALAQIIIGPMADRWGRERLIIIGGVIFMIGCALPLVTDDFYVFLIARLLQGGAAAVGVSVVPALIRSWFDERDSVRGLSLLYAIEAMAPALGPAFGTLLLLQLGWTAHLWLLLGAVPLALAWLVFASRNRTQGVGPAKTPAETPLVQHNLFRLAGRGYRALLSNRRFLRYALSHAMGFAAILTFVTAMPYLFESHYGMPVWSFAVMQLVLAGLFMITAPFAHIFADRWGADGTIMRAVLLQLMSVLGLLVIGLGDAYLNLQPGFWLIVAIMLPFQIGLASRGGIGTARAVDSIPAYGAMAGALLGLFATGFGAIGTYVAAPLLEYGLIGVALVCLFWVIGSLAVFVIVRPRDIV